MITACYSVLPKDADRCPQLAALELAGQAALPWRLLALAGPTRPFLNLSAAQIFELAACKTLARTEVLLL